MKIESKYKPKTRTSKQEIDFLKNQLVRALADYDNLRKRVEEGREIVDKLASLKVVARLLPVYDMLVSAQKHLQDSGLAITIGQFENALKEEGIERISVQKGDKFDHNLHEAVEALNLKAGEAKGTIAEIVLDGWRAVEGQVIRHTKVKVYSDKIVEAKKAEPELSKGDYM